MVTMKKKRWTLTGMPNARKTGIDQLIGSRIASPPGSPTGCRPPDIILPSAAGRRNRTGGEVDDGPRDRPRRPQDPRRRRHDHGRRRHDHPPRRDPPPRRGRHSAGSRRRARRAAAQPPLRRSARRCGKCRRGRSNRANRCKTCAERELIEETGYRRREVAKPRLPLRLAGRARREAAPVRRGGTDARPGAARTGRGARNRSPCGSTRRSACASTGEIRDAKTITSLLLWERLLRASERSSLHHRPRPDGLAVLDEHDLLRLTLCRATIRSGLANFAVPAGPMVALYCT